MPDYTVTVASTLPAGQQYVELALDPQEPPVQLTAGQSLTISDQSFAQINPALFSTGGGAAGTSALLSYTVVGDGSGQVTTQGAAVTLTSTQISTTGSGTELTDFTTLATAYNKLQSDVAALNAALSGTGKALA